MRISGRVYVRGFIQSRDYIGLKRVEMYLSLSVFNSGPIFTSVNERAAYGPCLF